MATVTGYQLYNDVGPAGASAGDGVSGGAMTTTFDTDTAPRLGTATVTYPELGDVSGTFYDVSGTAYFVPDTAFSQTLTQPGTIQSFTPAGEEIFGTSGNDTLDTAITTEGDDTIYGGADQGGSGSGDDDISGGGGQDLIYGGDGNDTLDGGAGTDTLYGEAGDDLLQNSPGDDLLFGGEGSDTFAFDTEMGNARVFGGEDTSGDDRDTLDMSAITNDMEVRIRGTERGWVQDGSGRAEFREIEKIIMGQGNDQLNFGAASGVGLDAEGGAGNDTLIGSSFDDTFAGGADDDRLIGNGGNDLFDGGAGNDSLDGGTGDDTLIGGAGANTLVGGDGEDTAVFSGNVADYSFALSGSDVIVTDATGNANTLTSIEQVTFDDGTWDLRVGTDGNDTISNDGGAPDIVVSGDGNDNGGAGGGDDIYFGGSGSDNVGGGAGNDTMYGGAGNDGIGGGDGNDLIFGGDGDDGIGGHAGNDTIYGGAGNDGFSGDAGDDRLYGDAGNDAIGGGAGNDTIYGGLGDDNLTGDDGNDLLFGDDGNDTMSGGAGNDWLSGDEGDDVMEGGAGNDLLYGGFGNDTLRGGTGDDSLFGGGGADVYGYEVGDGHDTIFMFDDTEDFIDLSQYYDTLSQLQADIADDSTLNQSNTQDTEGRAVDYADNDQFGDGSIMFWAITGAPTFTTANSGVPCFVDGTRIATPRGAVPVERLQRGDLVDTLDDGPQPITWIGRRHVRAEEIAAEPRLAPVRIRRGVLGNTRTLRVSRQHAMLLEGGHLARAVHLARSMRGIGVQRDSGDLVYTHLLFARHQIIFAEGIPSESFFPGPMALAMMSKPVQADLIRHILGAAAPTADVSDTALAAAYGPTARPLWSQKEVAHWARTRAHATTPNPSEPRAATRRPAPIRQ